MSEQLVYIARALDGSWAAPNPANSEAAARAQIEAHEPDEHKRSNYQILVEPLSRLLANKIPGIRSSARHHLVKWDGDGPIPDDAATQPHKYPNVAEVIEGGDNRPAKVIYRRS